MPHFQYLSKKKHKAEDNIDGTKDNLLWKDDD